MSEAEKMVIACDLAIKRARANIDVLEQAIKDRDLSTMMICVDEMHGQTCTDRDLLRRMVYLCGEAWGVDRAGFELAVISRDTGKWLEKMGERMPEVENRREVMAEIWEKFAEMDKDG